MYPTNEEGTLLRRRSYRPARRRRQSDFPQELEQYLSITSSAACRFLSQVLFHCNTIFKLVKKQYILVKNGQKFAGFFHLILIELSNFLWYTIINARKENFYENCSFG